MGKEDIPIEEVSTDSPDLSYDENRRFDTLTGAGGKSDPEAWAIILGERKSPPQDPAAPPDEAPGDTKAETEQVHEPDSSGSSVHDTVAAARKRFGRSAEEARVANQARADAIEREKNDGVIELLRDTTPGRGEEGSEELLDDDIAGQSKRAAIQIIKDNLGHQGEDRFPPPEPPEAA